MSTYKRYNQGLIVIGDAFDRTSQEFVDAEFGQEDVDNHVAKFNLTICDPPYGDIVNESWDQEEDYDRWFRLCSESVSKNSIVAMWGGIGKHKNRPFMNFIVNVELHYKEWEILNLITWGKRRAYGKSDNYLFTREECLLLKRGNPIFNIPYLNQIRGYDGFNKDYPAKSDLLRRTNVWTDINELFQNKIHPTQKPEKLYEVLIQTHTNPGDVVYDPCAGSLTTMRACVNTNRRFCVIERNRQYVEKALLEFEDQLVF